MEIFNWFGSILGYLLWFLYEIIPNYGVAIILFTIITKLLLLPFSVKQQKSMAANSKMAAKQQEIRTKYANDRLKMQEEMQKLMEQEGVNPTSGCLVTLIPFPIMLGIYYTVLYRCRTFCISALIRSIKRPPCCRRSRAWARR